MAEKKAKRTQEEKAMNGARFDLIQKLESSFAEPPPYSAQAPSSQSPGSNGIASIRELDFQPSPLEMPTPAECITHLKLLHALAKLRHDVGNTEGLYGISLDTEKKGQEHHDSNGGTSNAGSQQPQGVHGADAMVPSPEAEANLGLDAALAERIRDKRWAIFVHKAVARYESWWESHSAASETFPLPIKMINFESSYDYGQISGFTSRGLGLEHNPNFKLPPLDVLMVWHSHMLNPRNYLEDCIRHTRHTLWRTSFPWKRIHDSIDDSSYEYSQADTFTFMKLTGHHWDPLRDEGLKRLTCPKCAAVNRVPWTRPPEKCSPAALEAYLTADTGFSGSSFSELCSTCGLTLTHEKLRVGKFIEDADAVLRFSRPLAGTILTEWGVPGVTAKGKDVTTHDPFFPNRVVQKSADFDPFALRKTVDQLTVDSLRKLFEYTIKNSLGLALINSGQNKHDFVAKESRTAVRKVLSHYWDNSSMHGLDLVGAVLRQGSFVQKMKKLDWLHSPSLLATTQRLIIKYHRMIQLAADNPKKTVVPTLDVDLAWHTQQLSPRIYTSYTLSELKRLLNHDDKLPSSTLHSAFTWTAQAYEKRYGQPYAECSCWYCECTREPLRSSFLGKLSSRRSSISVSTLDEKGFSKSAHEGVHVSAHNALPVGMDARSAVERRRELEELDLQYAKVLKRYQKEKKGDAPPKKDDRDAYVYGAYGWPIIYPMPVYVPYGADPSCTEHAHDKSGGGGGGACAAGTCCPSTSLGACAGGEGTPGCKASCGGQGNADGGCGSCGGDGGGCGGCGG